MRTHYLQHVPFEGLGYIKSYLEEHRHQISVTRFYESRHHFPAPDDIDLLIIMGGPMSVHDESIYPWLKVEKAFIKACIDAGKKVLGICLGAQLIATSLGADVQTAQNKEIGWYPVKPTPDCNLPPWFYQLFKDEPMVFHWHGEQFAIPENCVDLLSSDADTNQAFAYRDHVLGLQFHLEVDERDVHRMIDHCADDLKPGLFVQSPKQIITGTDNCTATHLLMKNLLDNFMRKLI